MTNYELPDRVSDIYGIDRVDYGAPERQEVTSGTDEASQGAEQSPQLSAYELAWVQFARGVIGALEEGASVGDFVASQFPPRSNPVGTH